MEFTIKEKKAIRRENSINGKVRGLNKVNPLDALRVMMSSQSVLVPLDVIPKEFDKWCSDGHAHTKNLIPLVDQQDFFLFKDKRMSHRSIGDITTRYCALSCTALKDFYGYRNLNMWRFGSYNRKNFMRMKGSEYIPFERWCEIIDVCSAGLWELTLGETHGCYIRTRTFADEPASIIKQNHLICANMSHVVYQNTKFFRAERKNDTPYSLESIDH